MNNMQYILYLYHNVSQYFWYSSVYINIYIEAVQKNRHGVMALLSLHYFEWLQNVSFDWRKMGFHLSPGFVILALGSGAQRLQSASIIMYPHFTRNQQSVQLFTPVII